MVGYKKTNYFRVEVMDNFHILGSGVDEVVEPVKQLDQVSRDFLFFKEAGNVPCLQGHLGYKGAEYNEANVIWRALTVSVNLEL